METHYRVISLFLLVRLPLPLLWCQNNLKGSTRFDALGHLYFDNALCFINGGLDGRHFASIPRLYSDLDTFRVHSSLVVEDLEGIGASG